MVSNVDALEKTKKKFTPIKYRAWGDVFEQPLKQQNSEQDTKPSVEYNVDKNSKTKAIKSEKSQGFGNINKNSKTNAASDTQQDTAVAVKHFVEADDKEKTEALKLLLGNSKKIMSFFIAECIKNKSNSTVLLSNAYIAQSTNIKMGSIRNTISRLIKKGVLQKASIKKGGAGVPSKYSIPINIYNHIGSELNKDFTYSSPYENENQDGNNAALDNAWSQIYFDDLKEYGFNDKHIQQIEKLGVISSDDLQDSINYFVFDLLENNKTSDIKKTPVDFFMGIIRKQGFYTVPKNFESLKDRALRLKTEQEKQKQDKREKNEEALFKIEFKKWRSGVTAEEIEKLVPEEIKNDKLFSSPRQESFLKTYFNEKYWPDIQQEKYADCF